MVGRYTWKRQIIQQVNWWYVACHFWLATWESSCGQMEPYPGIEHPKNVKTSFFGFVKCRPQIRAQARPCSPPVNEKAYKGQPWTFDGLAGDEATALGILMKIPVETLRGLFTSTRYICSWPNACIEQTSRFDVSSCRINPTVWKDGQKYFILPSFAEEQ